MIVLMRALGCLLLLSHASLLADVAPKLRAFVDERHIQAGQSIRLTVEYSGKTSEQPDFSVLKSHFSKISEQQGRESSIINGNFSEKTTWTLELLPKSSEKLLVIPPIKLGSEQTAKIEISQSESLREDSKSEEGVSLKVYTDKDQVYIHGQLIVNIEVKTTLSLRNGALDQLKLKNCIVEPLIENEQSEVIENGIKYLVVKSSYAVFPNQAGALTVPVINFSGMALKHENTWPGFFSSGSRVNARSHEIPIKVMDVPSSYPKDQPFLPVKNLGIIESIENEAKFEVNQATTRRFEIKAQGTLSTFLPTLQEPSVNDLQIYSEEGEKKQVPTEEGMMASHKVSHVYMPLVPGPMIIPEQIIYWWDTDKDELKTTVIRKLAIDVGGKASINSPKQAIKAEEKPLLPKIPAKDAANYWVLVLIIVFLSAILGGLYALQKRKEKNPRHQSKKQQLNSLIKKVVLACDRKDLRACYLHLKNLLSWPALELFLVDPELKNKMLELEKNLYQDPRTNPSLLLEIKKLVQSIKMKKASNHLDPIYPR